MVSGMLNLDTGSFNIEVMDLVETSSSKSKQTRKNSDDLERAKQLFQSFTDITRSADLVCVEIPVGSQSARAMCSYGMCIGLLASVNTAMIQVTPSEVKVAATGNKNASKLQMIDWAVQYHPDAEWLQHKRGGNTKLSLKNEHLADALGAIHAGILTNEFKILKLIYTGHANANSN